MSVLILLVIATIIITGSYVGYHSWQSSLHEEVEKHFEPIESAIFKVGKITQTAFSIQSDQIYLKNNISSNQLV